MQPVVDTATVVCCQMFGTEALPQCTQAYKLIHVCFSSFQIIVKGLPDSVCDLSGHYNVFHENVVCCSVQ